MQQSEKDGEPEIAYYDILGTKWKQEQGTYEDDCKTNVLIERMQSEVKIESIVFGIDLMLSNALLPELFSIILKEHTPTIWSKIKQRYFAWKNGLDLKQPILKLQQWQRRKILQDFFVLNHSSIPNSKDLESIFNLISMNLKSQLQTTLSGKSPSSMPQMETMHTEKS